MSAVPTRPLVSGPQRKAFQRQLERGRVALTPINLLAAVEGLKEKRRRRMMEWLWVPNAKLDEIESQHPHLSDRLREVFSYFLRVDPDASWRSVLKSLDAVEETKLVDRLRQLAEPVTDPTLTVEVVAAALQTVEDWLGVAQWLGVPHSIQGSIHENHSTDEEKSKALAEYFTHSLPAASWSLLAGALSCCEEDEALEAVSSHLQREDEPTLTLPNLRSVLEGVTDWYGLGGGLGVPLSKRDDIQRRSPTASKGMEVVLKEFLEKHPVPSWRGLAWALYRMREHTALQRVYQSYLPAPTQILDHENRKMEYDDLVFGEPITEGASSVTCRGIWKQWHGGEVAIKQISIADMSIEKEVQDLCELNHPNMLSLYGTASKHPNLYVVTELTELLCQLIHDNDTKNPVDVQLSLSVAIGVAKGMTYLHEKEVIHRELKSQNVWLTWQKVAKISVFHLLEEAADTGPSAWKAPEVMEGAVCTKRSDMFSFATLLCELLTHQVPFEGCTADQIQSYIVEGKRPQLPDWLELDLAKLIQDCWAGDPEKRPSFADILQKLEEEEQLTLQDHAIEHKNRKMDFTDLKTGEIIGEGTFGKVFRGTVKLFKCNVAIKKVDADDKVEKEIMHLCELKHHNIIKLYGTASKDLAVYIITELADLGSVYGHIQKNRGKPDMELSVHWATGVARGMSYLHGKDTVHRDLKSANVLLTSRNRAKLCDFGISRKMDHTTQATMTGTFPWMAPEVIMEAAYSKRCDLFSYGTVLWELATHEVPFEELDGVPFKIQMAIVNGQMPPVPDSVEECVRTLILSCWNKDPHGRPSFVEVLSVLRGKGSQEAEPGEGAG